MDIGVLTSCMGSELASPMYIDRVVMGLSSLVLRPVCLAGPEDGVFPSVCDAIPSEPEATDCVRTGGSIKVLANHRMTVVMFSPFGEASPADAQGYFTAINQALDGYRAFDAAEPIGFNSSASVGYVHRQLSAHGPAPRAVAVLPSLHQPGFQRIEIGLASPDGHVYRDGFDLWRFEIEVVVLGPAPL